MTPPGCVHIFDGFLPPRPAIFVEPAVLTSCVFALCCQPSLCRPGFRIFSDFQHTHSRRQTTH